MAANSFVRALQHPVGSGIAGGLLGLLPVGRLHGWAKAAFVLIPAVALFLGGLLYARRTIDVSTRRRLVLTSAVGALAIGVSQWLGVVIDRAVDEFLRRRKVKRPRAVIAAISGIATAAVTLFDKSPSSNDTAIGS